MTVTSHEALYPDALALAAERGGALLGLDTSGLTASVCLVDPDRQRVTERCLSAADLPSATLALAIAEMLDVAKISVASLSGIAVSLGPGSFTGLRVGLATVKGLAMGGDVAVYGASSLAVLAAGAGPGWIAPMLDARRGELFGAVYHVSERGITQAQVLDAVWAPAALLATLQAHADATGASVQCVGDAATAFVDAADADCLVAVEAHPSALLTILVAQHDVRRRRDVPLNALLPNYLRISEAERQQAGR